LQPRSLALTGRDSDRRPLKELRPDNRFDLGIKLFAGFLDAPFAYGASPSRRLAICRLASQLSAENSLPALSRGGVGSIRRKFRRLAGSGFRRPKKRRVEALHPEGAIRNLPRPPDRGDPAASRREDSPKPYLLPTAVSRYSAKNEAHRCDMSHRPVHRFPRAV